MRKTSTARRVNLYSLFTNALNALATSSSVYEGIEKEEKQRVRKQGL